MVRMARCCVLGLLLLEACSTGKAQRPSCSSDQECSNRTFCGPLGTCTFECRTADDCGGAACQANGRCAGQDARADSWRRDQKLADSRRGDGPRLDLMGSDQAPLDLGIADQPGGDAGRQDQRPSDLAIADRRRSDQRRVDVRPGTCADVLGRPCYSSGVECAAGGPTADCLLVTAGTGVCTCGCTPENPNTGQTDTCPGAPQNVCLPIPMASGVSQNYCFQRCSPKMGANDCQSGLACDPKTGALQDKPGQAVCLYPGCSSDADCPVTTAKTCDTRTPSATCTASETCVPLTSATTMGRCARAGACDPVSRLCAAHALGNSQAKVGDACTDDTQCGGHMFCQLELDMSVLAKKGGISCSSDAECCSGKCQASACTTGLCTVRNRNGYCSIAGCSFASTLTLRACPQGSLCNRLLGGGYCQKSCSITSTTDCRGNSKDLRGDYECHGWNNLTVGGTLVSDGPVCEPGTGLTCAFWKTSGLDCSYLGDQSAYNPTNMRCRGLDNVVKTDDYDPLGFCFDNTSSGTQSRNPIPQP
jgi:hypothetical protein